MSYRKVSGQIIEYRGESDKARERREREGWFQKYAPPELSGIDIGCGGDPINQTFRQWDERIKWCGDATLMSGIPSNAFHTVYTSHVLEHLQEPQKAIRRWYEITRPGGHLIIIVPHRDLYEQKTELPSRFNGDHKHFWLPEKGEYPWTRGLKEEVLAALPNANIVSLRVLDEDYIPSGEDLDHPMGEYSIEVILRKADQP